MAADDLCLLDMVGDKSVGIYYDIGNSTFYSCDVSAEIRNLDGHIAQIHFKDSGKMLPEGKVDLNTAVRAILDIGYKRWIVLETAMPSGNADQDFRINLQRRKPLSPLSSN